MTPEQKQAIERAIPENCTVVMIHRSPEGQYALDAVGKWEPQYAYEEGRAYHFAMGVYQLFETAVSKVEKLGYTRSRAKLIKQLLESMTGDAGNNIVDINPQLIRKNTEELLPDGA